MHGGVGLGLWGAAGLLVLVVGFDIAPAAIPGEVLLIVLTVIMAASAMEVAGGIDFLVRIAERIIRKNPKEVNGYFLFQITARSSPRCSSTAREP